MRKNPSIIAFFRKSETRHSVFTTTVAPAVACLCLLGLFLQVSRNLELLTIAGAGHLSNLEDPTGFSRLLDTHLERCGVGP